MILHSGARLLDLQRKPDAVDLSDLDIEERGIKFRFVLERIEVLCMTQRRDFRIGQQLLQRVRQQIQCRTFVINRQNSHYVPSLSEWRPCRQFPFRGCS